jgi:uncharacterized delta-60 repeat protein
MTPTAWSASGDLDPSFGTNGVAVATLGGSSAGASAIVRQADGKLVAAGGVAAKVGEPTELAVARFDASGVLDPAFGGGNGFVTTDIGPFNEYTVQVMIQSDDKIVVVGRTETVADGSDTDIVLVRYNSDGSLDGTFGTGGVVTTSLGVGSDTAYAAALQSDDKAVVVGGVAGTSATEVDLFVARYDTSGSLDGTFGTGGVVTLDFGGRGDAGHAVVVQPDDYIVVAGTSFDGPLFVDGAVATLTRLDPSGTPDAGFGTGGSVIESGANVTIFNSLVRQSDGSLVVFGAAGPGGVTFRLYRYDSSGVADGGFAGGPSPFFMTAISSGALALGGGGEFAMLGDGFRMTRISSGGSLDPSFGQGGLVSLGLSAVGYALATVIEPSGDIVLAGTARVDFSPQNLGMTLVRVLGSSAACTTDLDCSACERCDGSGFCMAGARSGCTTATPGGAKLKMRNKSLSGKSKLVLKWSGAVPSFDPTMSDDVGICVYHDGDRILKSVAPAGGTCDAGPCWTGSAPDYSYLDVEQTPDGVRKMNVTAAVIKASARGPKLDATTQGVPPTYALGPPGPPVLLQLHAGNGACVEATFDADRNVKATSFSGTSD